MLKQSHHEYKGFREPGIRLTEPLLPSIESHRSDWEQPRLYAIHLFDKAHTTMLTERGLIPFKDGAAILEAFRQMEQVGVEKVRLEVGGGMHSGEKYLIQLLGEEVGGRIHLGRSSGDLGEVSTRIYIRDHLLMVMGAVNNFRKALIATAKEHIDTVMPGYTHGQHAQPTTYGHVLLSWASALERDFERLWLNFRHANESPAGAAILTGSDFPLDRSLVGDYLGFAGVEKNTIDAILSYDGYFETLGALSILYMNLARWAEDIMLWSTSEFNLVEVPDRFCGTSSIMMQKKNVYVTQWVKGAASDTAGGLMTAFLVDKAPTGLPILEHQYTRAAITRSFNNLSRDLAMLTELVPALKVNKERMLESAGAYWAQATDIAGMLVREKNIPWRTAHQIVGIMVRLGYERGIAPRQATMDLLDEASQIYRGEKAGVTMAAFESALDPAACVERRTLYGGPAPVEVSRRLPDYEEKLAGDLLSVEQAKNQVNEGLQRLERAISNLIEKSKQRETAASD